jgi:hypothetical protein
VGVDTFWRGRTARGLGADLDIRFPTNKILLIDWRDSDIDWMEPRDLTLHDALTHLPPRCCRAHRSWHPSGLGYVGIGPKGLHFGRLGPTVDAAQLADMLRIGPAERPP